MAEEATARKEEETPNLDFEDMIPPFTIFFPSMFYLTTRKRNGSVDTAVSPQPQETQILRWFYQPLHQSVIGRISSSHSHLPNPCHPHPSVLPDKVLAVAVVPHRAAPCASFPTAELNILLEIGTTK